MAGIGKKYDPVTLQQKFLFPRSFGFSRGGGSMTPPKPTKVTVTPASGQAVTGTLVHLDDFHVTLRDDAGDNHSWARNASLKVAVDDPYAAHIALLDKFTDKNIHDVVRFLEGLK